jgi:hypothetical protein
MSACGWISTPEDVECLGPIGHAADATRREELHGLRGRLD